MFKRFPAFLGRKEVSSSGGPRSFGSCTVQNRTMASNCIRDPKSSQWLMVGWGFKDKHKHDIHTAGTPAILVQLLDKELSPCRGLSSLTAVYARLLSKIHAPRSSLNHRLSCSYPEVIQYTRTLQMLIWRCCHLRLTLECFPATSPSG